MVIGARLGPYEIVAPLGEGGMGEVFRAHDATLNRDVALKVLLDSVVSDSQRVARFKREAHVLASLNHPHIAHLYGFEEGPPTSFLVMELIEGPTLAELIAAAPGGLPLDQALPIARQIADALEGAHEQGVIHRDLKPANVKVRDDGVVKVLDFGLAKAVDPVSSSGVEATNSPTLTNRATQLGLILGTAAYMAPEQAKGKAVDKRADVWAFGAVLYEMLTGRRLFDAEDISETLAAVLRQEITLSALPATTPPRLTRLIGRCLERDPRLRLRDIGEARIELARLEAGGADVGEAQAGASAGPGPSAPAPSRTRERIAWGAAVALLALAATGATLWALRPLPVPYETRLAVTTPATDDVTSPSFAISPDGRRLVFVAAVAGGPPQLWLRQLDQATAQPLAGTDGAAYPFWKPDSRSVGFFTGTQVKRLDLDSGLVQVVANGANSGRGGTWNEDDVILFGASSGTLIRVTSGSGTSSTVTTFAPGQVSHRFPHFLPGGKQFLFYAMGAVPGVYLGSLDSPANKRLAAADTSAEFVLPNWLLFVRQGRLLAQRFDLTRGEVTGEAVQVADHVAFNPSFSVGAFSVSPAGSIAYRAGSGAVTQLTWFDRSGTQLGTIGPPDPEGLLCPTLSPDGRQVVVYRSAQNNVDLYVFDAAARLMRRTFDLGRELYPVWSPDGNRLVFAKDAKGALALYQKASGGGADEEVLLESPGLNLSPQSYSKDGKYLLYLERALATKGDLRVLEMDGTHRRSEFLATEFEERAAQFSPNGKWVAYSSDQTTAMEIYVRPSPRSPGEWKASSLGGVTPRWRKDGKELYYIAPDGMLMAVSVTETAAGPGLGTPKPLFQSHAVFGGANIVGITWQYDVDENGRFLINVLVGDGAASPITVIQNWAPTAKK